MKIDNSLNAYSSSQETQIKVASEQKVSQESLEKISKGTEFLQYVKQNPEYQPSISEKTVIEAIENANKRLMGANTEIHFSVHERTKEIMVKIMNSETKEVVREIPPEKMLDMVAKMMELAGIIVDKKL